jgi:ABC-type proline/glycine betaine transport system substrate-binding protein
MLREWTGSKLIFGITILILMLSAGACSSQAAPTPQPSQPSMDPGEVQALVEAAVEAAVSKSAARSSDEISQQELREMMAEVLAEASPVPSKADLADLVAKSIKKELAARSAPISQADVADLVAKSIKKELAARSAPISQADVERIIQTEMVGLQVAVKVTPKPTAEVRKPTIVFSDLTWDSVRLQNRIAMFIVEQGYGYPVDAISGKTQVLWHNLLDGDSLVTMEVWLPNQQEDWDAAIIDGAIIPLGKSLDENWQGWVIPTYMTKNNIELQHVTDINDEDYIDLFVAPGKISERPKKAVLVTCPVDTECHDINLAKLKAYKLEDNVEMIVPASLADLQDSLDRAYLDERPWLGYMWGPTRLSEELDLTILGEPDYNEECWATTK